MHHEPMRHEIDELLRHAGWLRGLAAGLVRDPGRAEDLVQETWIAALRRPPLAGASPRPWLERVFRNLARNGRRNERTRGEHEVRATPARSNPGPDAIAEEVEAQRLLVEAVGRLADPERTIVVLRYFRGLDASAIGRELALPPGTVRWRLKTALEELRRELDRRFEGRRRAWSALFLRVLASSGPAGGAVSVVGPAVGAALVLASLVLWSAHARARTPGEPASRPSATLGAYIPKHEDRLVASAPTTSERALVSSPVPKSSPRPTPAEESAPAEIAPAAEDELADLDGRVLIDGRPPSSPLTLEVLLPGKSRNLETDELGRFAVYGAGSEHSVYLSLPGFLPEEGESLHWHTPVHGVVVRFVTPSTLRGRVVMAEGLAVPGARGSCRLLRFGPARELDQDEVLKVACDADGRFAIPLGAAGTASDVDTVLEAKLRFEVPRKGSRELDTGAFTLGGLDLGDVFLEPVHALAFEVRDGGGAPLAGAVARLEESWLSQPSSPTNSEGKGELRLMPERTTRVRFSALGYADRVLQVEVGARPVAFLEPIAMLELRLVPPAGDYDPLPTLLLTAEAELFDAEARDPRAPDSWRLAPVGIQIELGATAHVGCSTIQNANGFRQILRFEPDTGGRVLLAGLRPGIAFTLEALCADGRLRAGREFVAVAGEWLRVEVPLDP